MILKWVIVAALYVGTDVVSSKVFALDPDVYKTAADCETFRADLLKQSEAGGHTVMAKCVELDFRPPDPKKPSDKKSEVTS